MRAQRPASDGRGVLRGRRCGGRLVAAARGAMAAEDLCNVFRFCKCLAVLGRSMLLVVPGLCGVSMWAVVRAYERPLKEGGTPQALVVLALVVFAALIALTNWAFLTAALTDPGHVPPGWHPFASTAEAEAERERLEDEALAVRPGGRLAGSGRPRWCRKCGAWKPERAHHDSATGTCVLKLDHYCIWLGACVGLLNQKAFLLFLAYCLAACAFGAALLIGPIVAFFRSLNANPPPDPGIVLVFIGFLIDFTFGICLLLFVGMHVRLVLSNCTTIEMYEKRRVANWPYQRGWRRNAADVFGGDWRRWGVPALTPGHRAALLEETLQRQPLPPPPQQQQQLENGYNAWAQDV